MPPATPPVHYYRNFSLIPVEGLTTQGFFAGIEEAKSNLDEEKIRVGQREAISRLQKVLPQFIDDKVTLSESQGCVISSGFGYEVPLPHGKVKVRVEVYDDLEADFQRADIIRKGEKIEEQCTGKGGFALSGKYCWSGNQSRGLQLGRCQNYLFDAPASTQVNERTTAFERLINALCRGVSLTKEHLLGKTEDLSYPLCYADGDKNIPAKVRDFSLAALRAGDQPIDEFLRWMQENARAINTAGELVRLAAHSYLAVGYQEGRVKEEKVRIDLPSIIEKIGGQYLQSAQQVLSELHPPKNNRMDYLVR